MESLLLICLLSHCASKSHSRQATCSHGYAEAIGHLTYGIEMDQKPDWFFILRPGSSGRSLDQGAEKEKDASNVSRVIKKKDGFAVIPIKDCHSEHE